MDLKTFCRLCAINFEYSIENDLFSDENRFMLEQLRELTGIVLKNAPNQNLPGYFCEKCKDDLFNAYDFRNRVINSQAFFKSQNYKKMFEANENISSTNSSQHFDAIFLPTKQLEDDELNDSGDLIEKINCNSLDLKSEEQSDDDEDETYKPIIDDDDDDDDNDNNSNDNDFGLPLDVKIESDENYDAMDFLETTIKEDAKQANKKQPKPPKTKREKSTTKKPREKKKPKPPGIKMYKCHNCELEFKRANTRTKHERLVHARDWPFLCTECGKRFTTHDMGRRHMLVHTKIRNFHCTVCKASFLQKKHLTTHYRSETHKNNEAKLRAAGINVELDHSQTLVIGAAINVEHNQSHNADVSLSQSLVGDAGVNTAISQHQAAEINLSDSIIRDAVINAEMNLSQSLVKPPN